METILENHLNTIAKEFHQPHLFEKETDEKFFLFIEPFTKIRISYLNPGFNLFAYIHEIPTKNLETFFMYVMEANFLGQGTASSVIGLSTNEKSLTLSMRIPYEVNYVEFKEKIEEYLNHLEYWKTQTQDFINKQV